MVTHTMDAASASDMTDVEAAVRDIADPEIPVLTLGDLGIVREVVVDEAAGTAYVALTPTYSGCPATRMIEELVIHQVRRAGLIPTVETKLSPAWSTDWMSERGPGCGSSALPPRGRSPSRRVHNC